MTLTKRILAWAAVLAISAAPAWADPASLEVRVTVRGMVCSFCAVGIKKRLGADPAVQKVQVSLEDKRVTFWVDPQHPLGDERITELVKDAGYEVDHIEHVPPAGK